MTISTLDTNRFGVLTAKQQLQSLTDLDSFEQYAAEERIQFGIIRVSSDRLEIVQESMRHGFVLMDTLVFFAYSYGGGYNDPATADAAGIRVAAGQDDAEGVRAVATHAFQGYRGHYHADPRLPREACDAVYSDWAMRSCQFSGSENAILIFEDVAGIGGFGTLKYSPENRIAEGPLFAVHPRLQGRGIFRALLGAAKRWGTSQGAREFVYSTQITNLIVQKTLCREGFLPVQYEYTLHKWYDE